MRVGYFYPKNSTRICLNPNIIGPLSPTTPRQIARRALMLTDLRIRNAKPSTKPIKLTDGGGLYLEVTPAGGKHWRYRFRLNGKESIYVIGKYPAVGAAEARTRRDEARKLVT